MEKIKQWIKDWGAIIGICLLVIISVLPSTDGMVGGTITKPNTFSPGTVIRSSDINSNFDTLYNEINGNLDNANIDASANIAATKIAGTAIVSSPDSPQSITGTTTHYGSLFVSTTAGQFVVPRMTTAQRTALVSPINGAIVYDSTAGQFYVREGGSWTGISPVGVTATSSYTGKGVIEQATGVEAAATTLTGLGSTDAPLAITADITTSSRQIVGYYVPVTRSDGTLSNTFGGGASGLATLDANTLVVQNPANASSSPVANYLPIGDASGTLRMWTGDIQSYVAGENISGATTPVPVFVSSTDGRVYQTNASATGTASFLGFVYSNVTTGTAVNVQVRGIIGGFSGLTVDSLYFASNTSANINAVPGTHEIQVGVAVSSTKLMIQKAPRFASGAVTFTATATTTIEIGFRPSKIRIHGVSSNGSAMSNGGWTHGGGNRAVWMAQNTGSSNVAGNINASNSWYLPTTEGDTARHAGLVDTITERSFRLNNTITGSANTGLLFWEAEGFES